MDNRSGNPLSPPRFNNSTIDSPQAVPSLPDDYSSSISDDLPPFANTRLSQGSFTLLPLHSMQHDYLCNQPTYESSNSEFIAEVLTLTSPEKLDTLGAPSPIVVPSLD
ncbi:hypothetical protein LOD99_9451 [Oopsacas minuta]|uniref:Uncharacterized protein n=1 Tax=Oopsacas minuta TaxID=111878 RepID=A0AAV7JBS2_9METZ|nr:hypothetical protein LOD99_9451 [Oopsacas minuta]